MIETLLAVVVLVAASGKAVYARRPPSLFVARIGSERLPWALAAVVLTEAVLALALWTRWREAAAIGLTAFLIAASAWLVGGTRYDTVELAPCRCFGVVSPVGPTSALAPLRPVWWAVRNGSLVGLALMVRFRTASAVDSLAWGVLLVAAGMTAGLIRAIFVLHLRSSSRLSGQSG